VLSETFARADGEIATLEASLRAQRELPLAPTVEACLAAVGRLLRAYTLARGRPWPEGEPDPLEWFKAFVKGDPSLNTVRDNLRELVYYRNCIALDRLDALPAKPAAMAVRTARHIYLYLRTRCLQERRIPADRRST
jgi:hypothetical protein